MRIDMLINALQEVKKVSPYAQIKMHDRDGNNVLFVLRAKGDNNVVFLADSSDYDLRDELKERFEDALKTQMDELNFYMELLDTGFTLKNKTPHSRDFSHESFTDVQENMPEEYEHVKTFMLEHGLIEEEN